MNKLDWVVTLLAPSIAVDVIRAFPRVGAPTFQTGINLTQCLASISCFYFSIRAHNKYVLYAIRILACVACGVALVMIYEQVTGHNPYALLGQMRLSMLMP